MPMIFHICSRKLWNYAIMREQFITESLDTEGFIHASKKQQLLTVANRVYQGQDNLIVLVIDPKNLISELRYEALSTKDAYPHIYGSLNLEAVVEVVDFPSKKDGSFDLPKHLKKYK